MQRQAIRGLIRRGPGDQAASHTATSRAATANPIRPKLRRAISTTSSLRSPPAPPRSGNGDPSSNNKSNSNSRSPRQRSSDAAADLGRLLEGNQPTGSGKGDGQIRRVFSEPASAARPDGPASGALAPSVGKIVGVRSLTRKPRDASAGAGDKPQGQQRGPPSGARIVKAPTALLSRRKNQDNNNVGGTAMRSLLGGGSVFPGTGVSAPRRFDGRPGGFKDLKFGGAGGDRPRKPGGRRTGGGGARRRRDRLDNEEGGRRKKSDSDYGGLGTTVEEKEYLAQRDQGVHTAYVPSVTRDDLTGWAPVVPGSASSGPQGAVVSALRAMRILGGGQAYNPTSYADPSESAARYLAGKPVFFNDPATERPWLLEQQRPSDSDVVAAIVKAAAEREGGEKKEENKTQVLEKLVEASKETKEAIVRAVVEGKYKQPRFSAVTDTLSVLSMYHGRDPSYKAADRRAFNAKVASLLAKASPAARAQAAAKRV